MEFNVDEQLLHQVDPKIIERYCEEIKDPATAKALLLRRGQKVGDYTCAFSPQDKTQFMLFVLEENKSIREVKILDPTIWSGSPYDTVYENLRYPILPDGSRMQPGEVHSTLMGYKHVAVLKTLDGVTDGTAISFLGVVQRFISWLRGHKGTIRLDPGLIFKILGHSFGLLGTSSYWYKGANAVRERECIVDYEGFSSAMGRGIIMQDIIDELSSSQLDPSIQQKIAQTCRLAYVTQAGCNNPSMQDLLALLAQECPITLMTGWAGHSVNITLTKTHLIFTNKGDGAGKQPGMHLYRIKGEVTEKTLKKLCAFNQQDQFPLPQNQHQSELAALLQLEYVETYKAGYQKVGCCVFANNRLCLKAATLLLGVDATAADQEFKAAKQRMREKWLETLFLLIDCEAEDPNLKKNYIFVCSV
jgi:hypothetical protein